MADKKQESGAAKDDSAKRKPWIKKTPTEIILEQVQKQAEKVAHLKKELQKEEAELQKMQGAAKMLSEK